MTTAILATLFVLRWLLDTVADLLNLSSLQNPGDMKPVLEKEFGRLLDSTKYERTLTYQAAVTRFVLLRRSVNLIVFLALLLVGAFGSIYQLCLSWGASGVFSVLIFAGALGLFSSLLSLPFDIAFTFSLEAKYGFNRTTPRVFVQDRLKGVALSVVLGAPVLAALFWFFETTGESAWWVSWLTLTVFQLLISFVAPVLILPLFNKFEPLQKGEVREAIENYARAENFDLEGIYTMDGSKRSTKANAFFAGFGKFRRLVVFDTLLSTQTTKELVAVVAHEVGHFRRGHILKSICLSIVTSGVLLWVFQQVASDSRIFEAFHVESQSLALGLVLASVAAGPILRLTSFASQAMSRKYEFEADEFSVRSYKQPQALASALKKLSVEHLSNLNPHRLKVWLDYSHPPVLERVRRLSL